MSDYPEVYTSAELTQILKVEVETVWAWARDDRIPGAVKLGSLWRFEKSAVVEWIASGAPAALKAGAV